MVASCGMENLIPLYCLTRRLLVLGSLYASTHVIFLQLEAADIFKETKQFTYKDGPQFVFMDLVLF